MATTFIEATIANKCSAGSSDRFMNIEPKDRIQYYLACYAEVKTRE